MGRKKKQVEEEISLFEELIEEEPLEEIMGTRYASYAKYVIQDRAIPDARDGLKPVQRRIIYAMQKAGLTSSAKRTKCARIVGDVMGHYHPHGDSSIYEALVRMSQDWKVNHPLIDFQGNKGSIDGDGPAHYRYTEARLSQIAEEMVRDYEKNTIDMELTYDDSQYEPSFLPARFPNLLVNGSDGIAVALATEIPTHNLGEVIEATIFRIRHPHCKVEDLLTILQGPDFPTGGIIYRSKGLEDIYLTGRGKVEVVGKTEIVQGKDKQEIIISEIPFKVQKINLVYEIDKLRFDKSINGIVEVRDESDLKQYRIVVELKKDAKADLILEYLKNKTPLRTSYNANMVAILNGHPKTMTLLDFIDEYIKHQISVILRRSKYLLGINNKRQHIVDGLIKAISILDDVVKTIRASSDKANAKENLCDRFSFTLEQAEAIVTLQLYRLTNTDISILQKEKMDLVAEEEELNGLLMEESKVRRLIVSDLKKISEKYAIPRKTEIKEKEESGRSFNRRDLIAKEETMVAISKDGYVKRSSIKSYKSSDTPLPGLKDGDMLIYMKQVYTTDYIIAFTSRGNFLHIPVFEIQESKWKEEGKHINYLISLKPEEKIVKAFGLSSFRDDLFFILLSKRGQIKRIPMSQFMVARYNRPVLAMRLLNDDDVVGVAYSNGDSKLFMATDEGNALLFNENDVMINGLKSGGVKAMSSLRGASMVTLHSFSGEMPIRQKLLLVTHRGSYRVFEVANMPLSSRLGRVFSLYSYFKNDVQKLVTTLKVIKGNDEMLVRTILTDKTYYEFTVDDLHLTPMEKYAKKMLDLPNKSEIESVFDENYEFIDDKIVSIKVEKPLKEEKEEEVPSSTGLNEEETNEDIKEVASFDGESYKSTEEEEKEENYEQISIFDDDFLL